MNIIEGIIASPDAQVAIIVARFNNFINKHLLDGAIDTLKRLGQIKDNNITIIWVPGAYEIPLTASVLLDNKKYNAIIALGTIIRGNTSHFDYVSKECISGLSLVSLRTSVPIIFGILTTENIKQSIERAGTKKNNKGVEAALTALEMITVITSVKTLNKG